MKCNKFERQSIKNLSDRARVLFETIERHERGKFVNVASLCEALDGGPTFVAFSCLSGDGEVEELGQDLGSLFATRLRKKTEDFMKVMKVAGHEGPLMVLIDDTEPVRVWQWEMSQRDVTDWYNMVIEDSEVPSGWEVKFWSDFEKRQTPSSHESVSYSDVYTKMESHEQNLLLYQLFEHMRKFPNKKLTGDLMKTVFLRAVQYSFQGALLGQKVPNAILLQTETPWVVKDPLYVPCVPHWVQTRNLAIVHPFPEERR